MQKPERFQRVMARLGYGPARKFDYLACQNRVKLHGLTIKPGTLITEDEAPYITVDNKPPERIWEPSEFCDEITTLVAQRDPDDNQITHALAILQRALGMRRKKVA